MKFFLLILVFFTGLLAFGQAGSLDTTFNQSRFDIFGDGSGPEGGMGVSHTIIQPDGKLIVFGSMTNYNGVLLNGIARLNPDGSLDESFRAITNLYSGVSAVVLLPNGNMIVAGSFTYINDTLVNRVARLKPNGSIDTTFNVGEGPNNHISQMQLQSNGKIIVSGNFTQFNSQPFGYIARLNEDGSFDNTFNTIGADYTVEDFVVKADDKMIIKGQFNSYDGINVPEMIGIDQDGYLDSGFTITNIIGSPSIKLQQDGKIILTGVSQVNGVTCNRITRLLADGSIDPQFIIGSGPNEYVYKTDVQNDGKIIVCGYFTSFNSFPRNRIVRLNVDGSVDLTFDPGISANDAITGVKCLDDGRILIGGLFTEINNYYRKSFACLHADGSLDSLFCPRTGLYENVEIITIQSDGKIVLGGDFKSYNDHLTNGIARLLANGETDFSFVTGTGFNGSVKQLSVQTSGKIIASGTFTSYNGVTLNNLARLNNNGELDPTFQVGSGPNNSIKTIALESSGKLLVGGDFTTFNGTNSPRLVRLLDNGTVDPNFNIGTGPDNGIDQIIVQDDGKIIVCGFFTNFNGINHPKIVRLFPDGTIDQNFSPFIYPSDEVTAMALDNENNFIYATSNGSGTYSLRRTNNAGESDVTIQISQSTFPRITRISPLTNGQYIVTTSAIDGNIILHNSLNRVNHDGSIDINFSNGGCIDSIKTFAIQQDSKIVIGGSFLTYNNMGVYYNFLSDHLARINNDTPGESQLDLGFYPVHDISCSGNGSAVAIGLLGVPPYQYIWSDGNPIIDSIAHFQQSNIYTCTVTDQLNNSKTVSILVDGPSQLGGIDLKTTIVTNSFRPGFESLVWLNAFNDGCIPASGQLKLAYDPLLDFVSSNPAPTAQNGDTLIWDFTNITYDSAHITPQITFNTSVLAVIGDTIDFTTIITPIAGDADTTNNIKYYSSPVVNGYDPNIKSVYPVGKCDVGYIEQDQLLTYTVQFQNTGNSEAINIAIIDSLSPNLDLNTVRVVGKSHEQWTEVLPGNVLKFHFDNINLPDSTSNEPESHGYVIFEVNTVTSPLTHNTEIVNLVDIYFDFNPPVRTNEVSNLIFQNGDLDDYSCFAAVKEPLITELIVFPNPTNNQIIIRTNQEFLEDTILITDLQGKIVLSKEHVNGYETTVDVKGLTNGVYLIRNLTNTIPVNRLIKY